MENTVSAVGMRERGMFPILLFTCCRENIIPVFLLSVCKVRRRILPDEEEHLKVGKEKKPDSLIIVLKIVK